MTAPSPFIEGTDIQFAWDSTSLGYLKTCPRLYYYVMIQGWSIEDENVHLRFGQEYHKGLEDFDRFTIVDGLSRKDALHETVLRTWQRVDDWNVDTTTKAGKYKNKNTLLRLIVDYLDHYNPDPAKTVVLDNGQPAVELSFRFELDWGPKTLPIAKVYNPETRELKEVQHTRPFMLCGHLDRVVEFNEALFVADRKTTTMSLGSYYFDQFAPHNQMSLYTTSAEIILETSIRGVIIDAAQILVGSSNFERSFTYRTKDQLVEWLDDLRYWLSLAELYAINQYWPMNDTACDKFGGCRYRSVCSKSPHVRETFLRGIAKQLPKEERWNPLKAR